MINRIVVIILLPIFSSCGILGLYKDDYTWDPETQAKVMAELNDKPIAREMDSLIKQIDSAQQMIPEDLNQTTLVIETYEYKDYLKTWENKYHTPKDDNASLRGYKKYCRTKNSLIKNPKYKIIYLDKNKINTFGIDSFRYVLKMSNRIYHEPEYVFVKGDEFRFSGYVTFVMFYIYDRETKAVFKQITDLSVLSKK